MAQEKPLIVGLICGDDATREVIWEYRREAIVAGNNDALVLLKLLRPSIELRRMHVAPSYFRQPRRYDFQACDVLWNAITDEMQNPKTLEIVQRIVAKEKRPVIGDPFEVPKTSRIETAKRLAGIDGVRVPKVLQIKNPSRERVVRTVEQAGFQFPAIVRRVGTHNGEVVGIAQDLDGLSTIFGDRTNLYNLIEFVDVRQRDGFYRKTRFFFVGDRIITRQHVVSDDWMIHGRSSRRVMEAHPELVEEARDRLVNGFASLPEAVRQRIQAIRSRVDLDYVGLDCCIREDGEIVLFECNATMNFNPSFANPITQHNRAALPRMMSAIRALIEQRTGRAVLPDPAAEPNQAGG